MRLTGPARSTLASFVVLLAAAPAAAQVLQPPPRASRPVLGTGRPQNPNAATHSLDLGVDLLGGYNVNHVPPLETLTPEKIFRPSSYTGSADVNLRYALAKNGRGLNVSGGGQANAYTNVGGGSGPFYSTNVNASGHTPLGAGFNLSLSQSANRSPYASMGLFSNTLVPGQAVVYDAEGNPVNGVIEGNTLTMNSAAALSRSITRGTSATVRYGYFNSRHDGLSPFSQKNHQGAVDVGAQIAQRATVNFTYRVADRDAQQSGVRRRDLHHGIQAGFATGRQISATRTLSGSVGGGADRTHDGNQEHWSPAWYATVAVDLYRSWNLTANYRQTSVLVSSPLIAPDAYLTHAFVLGSGGQLARWLELVLNAGYTTGNAGAFTSAAGVPGSYRGYTGTAQFRAALAAGWSMVLSVNHYRSELSGAASQLLVQGSGAFSRSSARVGFVWSMPLYDSAGRTRIDRGRGRGRS